MFAKLLVLFALAALAACREYPAGLHPAVCPNYPYCDVNALARHTPEGIPIPQWGLNPAVYSAPAEVPAGVAGAGARYPAGLNPALCPNYPYCW